MISFTATSSTANGRIHVELSPQPDQGTTTLAGVTLTLNHAGGSTAVNALPVTTDPTRVAFDYPDGVLYGEHDSVTAQRPAPAGLALDAPGYGQGSAAVPDPGTGPANGGVFPLTLDQIRSWVNALQLVPDQGRNHTFAPTETLTLPVSLPTQMVVDGVTRTLNLLPGLSALNPLTGGMSRQAMQFDTERVRDERSGHAASVASSPLVAAMTTALPHGAAPSPAAVKDASRSIGKLPRLAASGLLEKAAAAAKVPDQPTVSPDFARTPELRMPDIHYGLSWALFKVAADGSRALVHLDDHYFQQAVASGQTLSLMIPVELVPMSAAPPEPTSYVLAGKLSVEVEGLIPQTDLDLPDIPFLQLPLPIPTFAVYGRFPAFAEQGHNLGYGLGINDEGDGFAFLHLPSPVGGAAGAGVVLPPSVQLETPFPVPVASGIAADLAADQIRLTVKGFGALLKALATTLGAVSAIDPQHRHAGTVSVLQRASDVLIERANKGWPADAKTFCNVRVQQSLEGLSDEGQLHAIAAVGLDTGTSLNDQIGSVLGAAPQGAQLHLFNGVHGSSSYTGDDAGDRKGQLTIAPGAGGVFQIADLRTIPATAGAVTPAPGDIGSMTVAQAPANGNTGFYHQVSSIEWSL